MIRAIQSLVSGLKDWWLIGKLSPADAFRRSMDGSPPDYDKATKILKRFTKNWDIPVDDYDHRNDLPHALKAEMVKHSKAMRERAFTLVGNACNMAEAFGNSPYLVEAVISSFAGSEYPKKEADRSPTEALRTSFPLIGGPAGFYKAIARKAMEKKSGPVISLENMILKLGDDQLFQEAVEKGYFRNRKHNADHLLDRSCHDAYRCYADEYHADFEGGMTPAMFNFLEARLDPAENWLVDANANFLRAMLTKIVKNHNGDLLYHFLSRFHESNRVPEKWYQRLNPFRKKREYLTFDDIQRVFRSYGARQDVPRELEDSFKNVYLKLAQYCYDKNTPDTLSGLLLENGGALSDRAEFVVNALAENPAHLEWFYKSVAMHQGLHPRAKKAAFHMLIKNNHRGLVEELLTDEVVGEQSCSIISDALLEVLYSGNGSIEDLLDEMTPDMQFLIFENLKKHSPNGYPDMGVIEYRYEKFLEKVSNIDHASWLLQSLPQHVTTQDKFRAFWNNTNADVRNTLCCEIVWVDPGRLSILDMIERHVYDRKGKEFIHAFIRFMDAKIQDPHFMSYEQLSQEHKNLLVRVRSLFDNVFTEGVPDDLREAKERFEDYMPEGARLEVGETNQAQLPVDTRAEVRMIPLQQILARPRFHEEMILLRARLALQLGFVQLGGAMFVEGLFDHQPRGEYGGMYDPENAMYRLSDKEAVAKEEILGHYGVSKAEQERELTDLRQACIDLYKAEPAKLKDCDLPYDWESFQGMPLNSRDREEANRAYYRHPAHSAYRWLLDRNDWMDPNAQYAADGQDPVTGEPLKRSWFRHPNYLPMLVAFWRAAKDDNPDYAPKDETFGGVEARKRAFIESLRVPCRAHNQERTAAGEVDNLRPDNPTCYPGTNQNIFKALMHHPMMPLTNDDLKQECHAIVAEYFENVFQGLTREKVESIANYILHIDRDSNPCSEFDMTLENMRPYIQKLKDRLGNKIDSNDKAFVETYLTEKKTAGDEPQSHMEFFSDVINLQEKLRLTPGLGAGVSQVGQFFQRVSGASTVTSVARDTQNLMFNGK